MYCSKNSGADGPFSSGCGPNAYTGSPDWSAPFLMDTLHCTNSVCRNMILGEDYVWAAGAFGAQKPTWKKVSGSLTRAGSTTDSIIALNLAPNNPKAAAAGTGEGKLWWSENIYTGTSCTQAAANTVHRSRARRRTRARPGGTWTRPTPCCRTAPSWAWPSIRPTTPGSTPRWAASTINTPTTPGHLFEFKWSGSAWTRTNKTGNLPDVPASAVAVNPLNRKQVFVGTYFGFYYTDDIDAATPVWTRYQWGLPNTVIQYLTVDRGPAATPVPGHDADGLHLRPRRLRDQAADRRRQLPGPLILIPPPPAPPPRSGRGEQSEDILLLFSPLPLRGGGAGGGGLQRTLERVALLRVAALHADAEPLHALRRTSRASRSPG